MLKIPEKYQGNKSNFRWDSPCMACDGKAFSFKHPYDYVVKFCINYRCPQIGAGIVIDPEDWPRFLKPQAKTVINSETSSEVSDDEAAILEALRE